MSKFDRLTLEELKIVDNAIGDYLLRGNHSLGEEDQIRDFHERFLEELIEIKSKIVEQTQTNIEKARASAANELLELKIFNGDYKTVLSTAFGIMIRLNEFIRESESIIDKINKE